MVNQLYLRKDLFENISNVICVEMVRVKEKEFHLSKGEAHSMSIYICVIFTTDIFLVYLNFIEKGRVEMLYLWI